MSCQNLAAEFANRDGELFEVRARRALDGREECADIQSALMPPLVQCEYRSVQRGWDMGEEVGDTCKGDGKTDEMDCNEGR